MRLSSHWQRTRVGKEVIVTQSSNYNKRSITLSLKSLPSIPTFGSSLSIKSDKVVRVYLENVNGLNITSRAWKLSYKYCRLRRLWSRLEIDLINLVKMKINPALLSRDSGFKDNLFRSKINHTLFTNNAHKLIGLRQQGGILSSARGQIARFCCGSGLDQL